MASVGQRKSRVSDNQRQETLGDRHPTASTVSGKVASSNVTEDAPFEEDMSKWKGKKPSAFQRFMMNFTSVLGLPVYKNQRARQLGKVPPPACFQDERLDESPNNSPSMLRRSYSVGSKERRKKGRRPRTWRRRKQYKWESSEDHQVFLQDTELDDLCEAEIRALQDLAVSKLNRMDFNIPANLVKVLNQLSNPRNKLQRRSFRRKVATDKDSGCVFGQPLSRVVYQDRALSARRTSSPQVLSCRHTSTPSYKMGENESLNSVPSMSSNSIPGDSPPTTPLPEQGGGPRLKPSKVKSLSSSRLHSEVTTITSPPPLLVSPSYSQYTSFNFEEELDKNYSAFSNMSLDTQLQSDYIDEPVQMSPETERKLLLAHSAPLVPDIIKKSVDYLQSKGIMMEGIFRVSGAKIRINKIRERFDRGGAVKLSDDLNPHDVACLLKEYLRCLPEPLISKELYNFFLHTRKVEPRSKRRDTLRLLCLLLPKPNRDTLKCLLHFLNQVALHSNDIIMMDGTEEQGNKMSEENLGMIMGPNILHKRKIAGQSDYGGYQKGEKDDIMAVSQVVEDLITMERSIFVIPAELLDEAIDRMIITDPILADRLLRNKCKSNDLEDDEDQSTLDVRYDGYSKESSSGSRVPIHRSRSSDALRMRSTDVGMTSKKKLSGGEHSLCVPPAMEQILSVTRATSTPLGVFSNSTPTTEDTMHSRESLCEEPLDGKLVLDESTEDNQLIINEVDGKTEPPIDEGVHLVSEDKTENTAPDGGKRIVSADASTYVKHIQSGAEVGGESPLSAIHKRMNSESSSGSTSVVAFPGDCKHQGSDSAFSFTNSSLNTGSRSSSEGISPACEGQEGRLSATGVSPQPRKGPPYDSPKYPHISKEDVPSGKTTASRKQSKEDIDMLSLQLKFKELESKVAELDNQVTSLRQVPPFTSSVSQQRPSQFSELDYQFEKLTSELSILDFLSHDTPTSEGGSIRSVPGFYASGSSKHIHHSVHQKTDHPSHQGSKIRKISAPSKSASNSQTQSPSVPCSKSHSQSLGHTRSYSPSGSPKPTLNQNSEPQSSKSSPRASESSEVGNSPNQDDVLMEKGILQHGPERMV